MFVVDKKCWPEAQLYLFIQKRNPKGNASAAAAEEAKLQRSQPTGASAFKEGAYVQAHGLSPGGIFQLVHLLIQRRQLLLLCGKLHTNQSSVM